MTRSAAAIFAHIFKFAARCWCDQAKYSERAFRSRSVAFAAKPEHSKAARPSSSNSRRSMLCNVEAFIRFHFLYRTRTTIHRPNGDPPAQDSVDEQRERMYEAGLELRRGPADKKEAPAVRAQGPFTFAARDRPVRRGDGDRQIDRGRHDRSWRTRRRIARRRWRYLDQVGWAPREEHSDGFGDL